jgi:hypothetical protein
LQAIATPDFEVWSNICITPWSTNHRGLEKTKKAMPHPTRQEWFFACLKGTLASYLRPAKFSRVTLQQLDGLKRRIQISCGVSEEEIKKAIASWIKAMPYSNAERVQEIRRKYWP